MNDQWTAPPGDERPLLTLDERKALLWFRRNEPALPRLNDPEAPGNRMRVRLMQAGLIHFSPTRLRYDPPSYCLTAKGRKALEP